MIIIITSQKSNISPHDTAENCIAQEKLIKQRRKLHKRNHQKFII
jgi:hypothetical protein